MGKRWMAAVVLFLCMGSAARADAEFSVQAKAAILIEAGSGRVLYEQNADERLPMASTTKIMTALIAVEHCGMEEIVTAGANASGVEGTSIYLSEGESLTMLQMLEGLMLRSGNDAAVAIAEHIAGDVKTFASLMNARAAQLGADAYFVTPNGLDAAGHGASARAMALIARAAMQNDVFRGLVSMQEAVIPWVDNEYSRVLRNKNRLLKEYEGATGIKTGFTGRAGRCLVFSAEREGMELIGAVMNCPDWFGEAEKLLDWGFDKFSRQIGAQAGDKVSEANIMNGRKKAVSLCARETLAYPVCAEDEWRMELNAPAELEAPVLAGDEVGYMAIIAGGKEAARTALVAAEDVPRRSFMDSVREWLGWIPFFGRS